jgi:hypothetical protein
MDRAVHNLSVLASTPYALAINWPGVHLVLDSDRPDVWMYLGTVRLCLKLGCAGAPPAGRTDLANYHRAALQGLFGVLR